MIDREKVIKGLQIERECVSRNCDRDCGKCDLVQDRDWLLSVYDDALALLEEQKSVIEALKSDLDETLAVLGEKPEIVRCKGCKHWDEEYDGHCAMNHIFTTPDFYCADGEKAVKQE